MPKKLKPQVTDDPTEPTEPDPTGCAVNVDEVDDVLAGLGITSRSYTARKYARLWATILSWVSRGASDRDACRIARLSYRTWMSWLAKGRGSDVPGEERAPEAPWDELATAHDEARATVTGDIWSALADAAKGGDSAAAKLFLARQDLNRLQRERQERHRAEMELLALKIQGEKMRLEGTLPAQRTEVSGPAGGPIRQETVARIVLLPALEAPLPALNATVARALPAGPDDDGDD